MIFLILCIISSTLIFVIFKLLNRVKVPVLPVIVYNYLVASLLGFLITGNDLAIISESSREWLPLSVVIGVLFIVMFFVIGKSSQDAGISVTTVASKMSVVTPIVFSILADPTDEINLLKVFGIILALLAVFLTIYRKKTLEVKKSAIIYPVILFFGMGLVDSLVKYSQLKYISDPELALFSAILFAVAFLTGIIYLVMKPGHLKPLLSFRSLFWGSLLGLSNFGSIYFIIRALNYREGLTGGIDSSVVFGVNNTGIVVLSVLSGYLLFKEKLRPVNYLGIILAVTAIILFAYA